MLTIEYVKNLYWDNEEKSSFSCFVKYEELTNEIPSGINKSDEYEHIIKIWEDAIDGKYGIIADYIPQIVEQNIGEKFIYSPANQTVSVNNKETIY